MKQEQFMRATMLVAFLCIAVVASAREWHINNKQGMPAHFADINAAMASAEVADGDTLYLGAGCVINSNQTVSKRVTVIGTGWGYTDSPAAPAKINGTIKIQAENTKVIGLYVSGEIYIEAGHIVLERCSTDASIYQNKSNIENVKILQCKVPRILSHYISENSGWEIKNCIMNFSHFAGGFSIDGLFNATIENNVMRNASTYNSGVLLRCSYSVIKNNIMLCPYNANYYIRSCSNNTMYNNVLSASSGYSGNVLAGTSADVKAVFKCTGSIESGEYFSLIEGSPAIGAGEGGIDCGAMVGVYKFVPYGRPRNIPVLKEAVVPSMPTDGKVKVSFKIENQNE